MSRLVDIVGVRYGRLVVVSRAPTSESGQTRWRCRCDCGVEIVAQGGALKSQHTRSCGCLSVETTIKLSTKHRHAPSTGPTPTYHTWAGMVARCTNTKHSTYGRYGGRGIKVIKRWLTFENFLADMGVKPAGHSIDRIDSNGNYTPKNCRWANIKQQNENKGNNRRVTARGETLTVSEWARRLGMRPGSLAERLDAGWPPEEAVTLPKSTAKRLSTLRQNCRNLQ